MMVAGFRDAAPGKVLIKCLCVIAAQAGMTACSEGPWRLVARHAGSTRRTPGSVSTNSAPISCEGV
jgi:hypothetical protein